MAIKLKKSYRFALRSAALIALLSSVIIGSVLFSLGALDWLISIALFGIIFLISFAILQIRIERFIYRRIKKIYDDVALLESSSLSSGPINTDMRTLTAEIEKFAKDKKVEIDTLKIREEYRKDFLGNVSHELKTPLFTVQGFIETLLDGATKLEAGEMDVAFEEFDIIALIQNVFDLSEMKAAKKKIALVFDTNYTETIPVKANREKIEQVLTNLIINSIKYGHENGTTEVSVENLVQNKVIVRVTDNGEGISKQHLPRLFERFYRVDSSRSRKEGGSGLGLAIVKHIIEAHGEKIYVESVLGAGSEFSFTLEKVGQITAKENVLVLNKN